MGWAGLGFLGNPGLIKIYNPYLFFFLAPFFLLLFFSIHTTDRHTATGFFFTRDDGKVEEGVVVGELHICRTRE